MPINLSYLKCMAWQSWHFLRRKCQNKMWYLMIVSLKILPLSFLGIYYLKKAVKKIFSLLFLVQCYIKSISYKAFYSHFINYVHPNLPQPDIRGVYFSILLRNICAWLWGWMGWLASLISKLHYHLVLKLICYLLIS